MVTEKCTIFPLLGINYRSVMSVVIEREKAEPASDLNELWFRFGGRFDYSFTKNIYLRTEVLYGIRLQNKFEKDLSNSLKTVSQGQVSVNDLLGNGLEIKLAIAYKLKPPSHSRARPPHLARFLFFMNAIKQTVYRR